MPTPPILPPRVTGRFSNHLSRPIAGNKNAGLFQEFPLTTLSHKRLYSEIFNDFLTRGDFYIEVFTGATGTVPTPDWIGADVGSAGSSGNTLLTDAPNGILRVTAGTTDATGRHVTRSPSGTNIANVLAIDTAGTIAVGEFRLRLNETGTATQSAFTACWTQDEAATIATTGALAGSVSHFGFTKAVGSSAIIGYLRTSATTSNTVTVGTLTPGAFVTLGWRFRATTTNTAGTHILECYLNGNYVGYASNSATTSAIAADAYAPAFGAVNGTGCDCTLDIDYYWAMTARS